MVDGWQQRSIEPTLPGDGPTLDDAEATGASARYEREVPGLPDRIGRFVVKRRLGAGGMGVVLEAHDERLDRPVAIKLLRGPARPSEHARLQREAQALARLSHPNVVQVFEAGAHEGRAYLAMELVEGVALDDWLVAAPRPTHEILAVFLQAGEGLAAAHAAGFVHRDFKPSNVIVGVDGRVRVLDFGLARTDPSSWHDEAPSSALAEPSMGAWTNDLTRTGAVMGTPAYMSPEQFWTKPATEASDQFGFCVALYQALYRRHPFVDERGWQDLMSNVLAGRLRTPPRTRGVPARVRRAVLRGLAKAPEDRWPTMARLLDELRRAQRPSAWRRTLVPAAATLAVLAGAWLVLETGQGDPAAARCSGADAKLAEVWGPAARVRVAQALRGTGLAYAEPTWAKLEPRLDAYAASWRSTFEQACEATQRAQQAPTRLDAQLACLERLRRALGDHVEVLAAADPIVLQQAMTAVAGLRPTDECLEPRDEPLPPLDDPERAAAHERLERQLERTVARLHAGKYADALALAEQADEAARALGYPPAEARAALLLGLALQRVGRFEPAAASLDRAYFLAHPLGHEVAYEAAVTLAKVVGLDLQDYARGLEWVRHAEAEVERSHDPLAKADVLVARGLVLAQSGELAPALAAFTSALELRERDGSDASLERAELWADMGMVRRKLGRNDEAVRDQERALATYEEALGPEHPEIAHVLRNLAVAYLEAGRKRDAEQAIRRALAIDEAVLGPAHPDLANALNNLGMILARDDRHEEAEAALVRAVAIVEAAGTQPHNRALALGNLALVQHWRGHYEDAAATHRKALALFEEAGLERHPDFALKLAVYGATLEALQEHDEAEAAFQRALAIVEGSDAHAGIRVEIHVGLARVAVARQRWADAARWAEQALALEGSTRVPRSHRANARFALARARWELGRGGRARAIERAREAAREAAGLGESFAGLREEIDAWLAEHAPEEPSR